MPNHEQNSGGVVSQTAEQSRQAAEASPEVVQTLQKTHPWIRFMSIVGFVGIGLMLLVGIAIALIGMGSGILDQAAMIAIYPLLGLVYFFPSLYLLRYANRLREFVAEGHFRLLEAALDAQRSFWKLVGILTLIGLCMLLVVLLGTVFIVLLATTGQLEPTPESP